MVAAAVELRPHAPGRLVLPEPDAARFGAASRPSGVGERPRPNADGRAGAPDTTLPALDGFLRSGGSLSLLHVQAQLSLEHTVYNQAGQVLEASSLSISYERTELLLQRYAPAGAAPGGGEKANGDEAKAPAPGFDPLQALRDYASPENTAGRIVRFATEGFAHGRFSGGTRVDARGAFRDFILPFIEAATEQVLGLFGDALPDDVKQDVHRTLDLVRAGLQRFTDGGEALPSPAADAEAGDAQPEWSEGSRER